MALEEFQGHYTYFAQRTRRKAGLMKAKNPAAQAAGFTQLGIVSLEFYFGILFSKLAP
jgi:hypothetical protein